MRLALRIMYGVGWWSMSISILNIGVNLSFFLLLLALRFLFDYSYKKPLVLALGDCIPVRPWSDSPIACIAELRMVWRDKNEQCLLASLRLYFLPENTPMGRNCHGEVSFAIPFRSVCISFQYVLPPAISHLTR